MSDVIAHVRLSKEDDEYIKNAVKAGAFVSKSDAIKTAIRLMEHSRLVSEITSKFGKPDHEELMKQIKEARKETYKKFFGSRKK